MSDGLVLREDGLQVTYIVRQRQPRLYGHVARLSAEVPPIESSLSTSVELDHVEGAATGFMFMYQTESY